MRGRLLAAALSVALVGSGVTAASAAEPVGITKYDGPLRGINLAGAEFSSAGLPQFDRADSFTYVASRGYTVVRLPFLWESMQPMLSAPLKEASVERLQLAVADAKAAGLHVIIDVHNYARYNNIAYGAPGSFTLDDFTDLWTRLATLFRDDPTVIGYGLMNEPRALPAVDGVSGNSRWQQAQQAALDAIRETGDLSCVLVSGYTAGTLGGWMNTTNGQPVPYITDPADNFRWEAHHYWDIGATGTYSSTYADSVATGFGSSQGDALRTRTYFELNQWIEWLEKYHQKGFIGEFGWPSSENAQSESDAAAWNALGTMYLDRINATDGDLLWTTAWATGSRWSNAYVLQFYSSVDGVLTTPKSNAAPLEANALEVLPPGTVLPGAPATPDPQPVDPVPDPDPPGEVPVTPPVEDPPVVVPPVTVAPVVPPVAVATTLPVAPTKAKAKTKLTVKTLKKGKRPKFTVTVKTGSVAAKGTVTVTQGKKTLAKGKLVKGKVTVTLKKNLKKGKQRLVIRYKKLSSVTTIKVK